MIKMIKRYSRAVMRDIWEEQNKLTLWLKIGIEVPVRLEIFGTLPSTGVVYSLMLDPTNFPNTCVGVTNMFVATATPPGKTFGWSPSGLVTTITNGSNVISTNLVPLALTDTNVVATYGPCSALATGLVTAVTNVIPNLTNICARATVGVMFTAQPSAPGTFPCVPTWTMSTNVGMFSTTQAVTTAFTLTNSNFRGQVFLTAHAGTSTSVATGNVYEVQSVVWVATNSPLTGNPNPGGGLRIFPDKTNATDTVSRSNVLVRATVSPAVSNALVYFQPFDVDDPWTNTAPIDADPNATDNRPTEVSLASFSIMTGTNGVASTNWVVSMQPGNNYRIVASCDPAFGGMFSVQSPSTNGALLDASSTVINETNFVTPMLTVWRSVHIEKDSMSGVVSNFAVGNIPEINGVTGPGPAGAIEVIISVALTNTDNSVNLNSVPPGNGRFENGFIEIGTAPAKTTNLLGNGISRVLTKPGQFFNIPFVITKGGITNSGQIVNLRQGNAPRFRVNVMLSAGAFNGGDLNVAGQTFKVQQNSPFSVAVTNNPATLSFLLHDDDVDTGANSLPKFPDTSLLAAALNEAYVDPKFNTTGVADQNSLNALPFDANLDAGEQFTNVFGAFVWGSVLTNKPDFWVAHVISCFQHRVPSDGDPDVEKFAPGLDEGLTLTVGTSAIFLETIRERAGTNAVTGERTAVVHEVGHAVGMNTNHPVTECDMTLCPGPVHYVPDYLDHIRRATKPFGP